MTSATAPYTAHFRPARRRRPALRSLPGPGTERPGVSSAPDARSLGMLQWSTIQTSSAVDHALRTRGWMSAAATIETPATGNKMH